MMKNIDAPQAINKKADDIVSDIKMSPLTFFIMDNEWDGINNVKTPSTTTYFILKCALKCKQASGDDILCSYFNIHNAKRFLCGLFIRKKLPFCCLFTLESSL